MCLREGQQARVDATEPVPRRDEVTVVECGNARLVRGGVARHCKGLAGRGAIGVECAHPHVVLIEQHQDAEHVDELRIVFPRHDEVARGEGRNICVAHVRTRAPHLDVLLHDRARVGGECEAHFVHGGHEHVVLAVHQHESVAQRGNGGVFSPALLRTEIDEKRLQRGGVEERVGDLKVAAVVVVIPRHGCHAARGVRLRRELRTDGGIGGVCVLWS